MKVILCSNKMTLTKLRKEFEKKFCCEGYSRELHVVDYPAKELWNWIEHSLQEAVKEERWRIVKEIENGTWPVYLRNTDLITKDRDIKIRRQMRKEIIDWLTQKPKGKGRE